MTLCHGLKTLVFRPCRLRLKHHVPISIQQRLLLEVVISRSSLAPSLRMKKWRRNSRIMFNEHV